MELIPDEYRKLDSYEAINRIKEKREELGKRLVILTHHYQREEIIELGDFRGDSLGLSRTASEQKEAEFIVFCGVHFMAESAYILSYPDRTVQLPDPRAGCPMANMAEIDEVEYAWNELVGVCGEESITPITYINSHAELKAFCGRHNGAVCTSTNAPQIFDWARSQRDKIFFFPDEHLGRNTANKKGIKKEEIIVWDRDKYMGGSTKEEIIKAQVILWNGFCHVHTWFKPEHVLNIRKRYPNGKIIVHPECKEEVVNLADEVGSTSYIVKYTMNASDGSTIIIGTEINLINRLAKENPNKRVFELSRSLCPNMYRINPQNLLWTLDYIGKVNLITVPDEIRIPAKLALDRMLNMV